MPAPRKETSRPVSGLREASSPRCATSSGSESAGSRSSVRPRRTAGGICAKSSSTESIPIVSSICSRSCSVRERKLIGALTLLLVEELLVGGGGEERVGFTGFRQADPDQPAVAIRVLIDCLGSLDNFLVDSDHFPGE